MKKVSVIVLGSKSIFHEITYSLIESLLLLGFKVENISWNENFTNDTSKIKLSDINIYIGALDKNFTIDTGCYNIYINTEQPRYNKGNKKLLSCYDTTLKHFNLCIDMFKHQIRSKDVQLYRYCPAGWSSFYERNYDPSIKKNINVLHLGYTQLKYTTIKKIRRHIKIEKAFKDKRDILIQQAKINLSLRTFHPYYEWTQYRMLLVTGLRGFLLAQEHTDYGPYIPGKHFITFKDKDFVSTYRKWLSKPQDMIDFGMSAYEDIKENHKYVMYLGKALEGII